MKYLFSEISNIVNGSIIHQDNDPFIYDVIIDSRKSGVLSHSVFFALKGPRNDGHDFIPELLQKGVSYFVVSELNEDAVPANGNFIKVDNTLEALQLLASFHRKQFGLPVVGITGSNGKTIVKEWINDLLNDHYQIVRSPRSYNSQVGVPLSVLQIKEADTLGVFEAGISQKGEMGNLEKIIQPTMGIFTNLGEAHSHGFENKSQKAFEKLKLFTNSEVLIYCKDYPEIIDEIEKLHSGGNWGSRSGLKPFSWSMGSNADLQIIFRENVHGKTKITGLFENRNIEITIPFTNEAYIENAVSCWCLLLYLRISDEIIYQKMETLKPVSMRMEFNDGINNCTIINDSYSADLSSLRIALDHVKQDTEHVKKSLILSDLLETGMAAKELYLQVRELVNDFGITRFIGIGSELYANRNLFAGDSPIDVHLYETFEDFKYAFSSLHFSDETILLKGARVFEFERIFHMLALKTHQTRLEVNLNALVHNLKEFQKLLSPSTKVMAMVKAFSYGSGSTEIARVLQYHNVDYLGVAYADEGIELRKAGIRVPIMVMNTDTGNFDGLIEYNLEPVIYSRDLFKSFTKFIKKNGLSFFPVHIEVNTGMNRLGVNEDELKNIAGEIYNEKELFVKSIFSHLVSSEDNKEDQFTKEQHREFNSLAETFENEIQYKVMKHITNTAGTIRFNEMHGDMVRIGLGLYGVDLTNNPDLNLQEISTLKSSIAQIHHLKKGETVSYNRSGIMEKDSSIATIRIGYADGYPRCLSNRKGRMLVKGQLAPVIGNICMDMTMVDITGIEGVEEGDEVIVFGNELSVRQVADWASTIPYEIMTGVSQRVNRIYFQE